MANSAAVGAAAHLRTSAALPSRTRRALLLRLLTRLRRPWLDAEIARGVELPGDRALALRKAQVAAPRERRRLATRLESILGARTIVRWPGSAVPIDQAAVQVARPLLAELIRGLRSSEPIEARGVVLGWRLFTDPCSPIYAAPDGGSGDLDRLWYESLSLLFALRPLPGAKPAHMGSSLRESGAQPP
jgi:hypothetical protein